MRREHTLKQKERGRSSLKKILGGNVFMLGWVSFFTDVSSEMIYPLLPVFFTGIVPLGTAAIYIGIMDGLAESVSSILKLISGRISDRSGRRKPLALAGYGLSGLTRPMITLATAGWHVVFLRFVDRIGKGIRTAPRDALISNSVDSGMRGVAFSFHRMMDHAGAVCGPILAAAFLYAVLGSHLFDAGGRRAAATADEMNALRWLFALSLIPGMAAMLILWRGVRESATKTEASYASKTGNMDPQEGQQPLPGRFYVFIAAVTLFTLGNSSDLFLIYFAQTRFGLGTGYALALWVTLHVSKIVFSLPGGRMADRLGRHTAILSGWTIYMLVYFLFPFAGSIRHIWILVIVYGAYYGLTEGAERALVADFAPCRSLGHAFGSYHAAIGFAALPASLVFGVFWAKIGPLYAFLTGAFLAFGATIVMIGLFVATRRK